jgi:hypothetical protein
VVTVTEVESVKHSEPSMLKLLRERHAAVAGNGPVWAYLEHVRNAAGFAATRTLDAMALSLWPSRGHELHGYEVKISRADFRRELADGGKADAWHGIVDRFWIVAPLGIVPKAELPATWGLLETDKAGKKLRSTVPAPLQTVERAPIARNVLVPMLRAAGAAMTVTPERAALDVEFERGRLHGREQLAFAAEYERTQLGAAREELERLKEVIREFKDVLGVDLGAFQRDGARVAQVVEALRTVLADDTAVERARSNVERAASDLDRAAEYIRRQAEWIRDNAGRHA